MKIIPLLISLLFFATGVIAQKDSNAILDVSKILANKNIADITFFYADPTCKMTIDEIAKLKFKDSLRKQIPSPRRVPKQYIAADIYFNFVLSNSSDSTQYFYYGPGGLFPLFELYKVKNGVPEMVERNPDLETNKDALTHGYRLLPVNAGDTATYIAKLHFVKTTINYTNPKLVRTQYASQQVSADISITDELGIITFIISGFFLMMIFYSLANYRQAYRPEFLYYGGYTFCVAILLFLKAVLIQNSTWFNFLFEGYLDFLIQLTSVFLYLLFIRTYLSAKVNYPFIENVLRLSQWVVIGATVLYTYVYFATDNFLLQNNLELYTKYYLVVLGIIFIIAGFRYKDKLLKYLVYGNINLIFFGLVSLFFIVSSFRFKNLHWIFSNSLLYYDLSVLGECILFLIGLSYKNRKELIEKVKMEEAIKLEQERRAMEKQLTVIQTQQEERNRISADMHDELGAGMTAIRLMSEMAKTKTKDNPLPEIEKISDSSNDLLNKMNAIIWSMNSSNDTLPNLVSYIRSYAITYFESFDIDCKIDIHENVPEKELNGEKRRNIFLTVKEALNNVVKHSRATRIKIDFSFDNDISIKISDNGIGINKDKIREFGNGLNNMRKRMERIGGSFQIENNNGTNITLVIPIE